MKGLLRTAACMVLAGSLVFIGSGGAGAEEPCSMGGTMVKVTVDKDKAVEWFDSERRNFILSDEEWTLSTVSKANDSIALVLGEEFVFFGVADDRDDREADERRRSKAFGSDLRLLKGAILKEIKSLWKDQVIDIGGSDVQDIVDAAGIGVLSLDGRDWVLEAQDCEGMTVNLEDLED